MNKVISLGDRDPDEQETAEFRKRLLWLARATDIANKTVALVPMFALAASTGDPVAIGSVMAASGGLILKESIDELKAQGKEPKMDKVNYDTLLELAAEGGKKVGVMRALYKKLITNCMDPAFGHDIRHDDLALLKSLNPSDLALVMIAYKHGVKMSEEFPGWRDRLIDHNANHTPMVQIKEQLAKHGFTTIILRKYFKLEYQNELVVSDDELKYALWSRGNADPDSRSGGALFKVILMSYDRRYWSGIPRDKNPFGLSLPQGFEKDDVLSYELTTRANRLGERILRS